MSDIVFFTYFLSSEGENLAKIVIESLQKFGGIYKDSPVWVFFPNNHFSSQVLPGMGNIERIPLEHRTDFPQYPFAIKVFICANAEALAGSAYKSLVMLSLDCLFLNPPFLFDLNPHQNASRSDSAFRPVHHRNIGSLAAEPKDPFWQAIYQELEVVRTPFTINSFADKQELRPYFNTHCFSINPALGLAQMWWDHFISLIKDQPFQETVCTNEPQKIFLHQAILSTIIAKHLTLEQIRLLPLEYNYPLNLLDEIPDEEKPVSLNRLVNVVYEDTFPCGKIKVDEPLKSWLKDRLPGR
jgi:hypothetical protein